MLPMCWDCERRMSLQKNKHAFSLCIFHVFSMQFLKFKRLLVETYLCQCYFFLLKQYCLELRKRQLSQAILRFSWSFRFLNFFLFFKSRKAIAGAIIDLLLVFF